VGIGSAVLESRGTPMAAVDGLLSRPAGYRPHAGDTGTLILQRIRSPAPRSVVVVLETTRVSICAGAPRSSAFNSGRRLRRAATSAMSYGPVLELDATLGKRPVSHGQAERDAMRSASMNSPLPVPRRSVVQDLHASGLELRGELLRRGSRRADGHEHEGGRRRGDTSDRPGEPAHVVVFLGDAGEEPAHADAVGAMMIGFSAPSRSQKRAAHGVGVASAELEDVATSTPGGSHGERDARQASPSEGGRDVRDRARRVVASAVGVQEVVAASFAPDNEVGRSRHGLVHDDEESSSPIGEAYPGTAPRGTDLVHRAGRSSSA